MFSGKLKGNKTFYYHVLSLSIPIMVQQLATASLSLLDSLMIGQMVLPGGEKGIALAGVITVSRLFNVALFALYGVMGAASVYIAQFFGAKDKQGMKQSFRFGLLAAISSGCLFCLLGLVFPEVFLRFFTDDPLIIKEGMAYLEVVALTIVPLSISIAIGDSLRVVGEIKKPLIATLVGSIANVVFNYILIFGNFGFRAMGVRGAGIATMIARLVEMIILLFWLYKGDYPFKTKLSQLMVIDRPLAKAISKRGLPLIINEIFWALGISTLYMLYSTRGSDVMVGYGICTTVSDVFFVIFSGFSVATTVIISQNLGADKLEEAKGMAYQLIGFSVVMALAFGVVMFGSSFIIPRWYNVTDEARLIAEAFIRIVSFMIWIYMVSAQCYFILRAGGDSLTTLYMDAGYMWLVNILVVGSLAYFTDLPIIWLYLAGQATDLLKMLIAYYLLERGNWVKNLTKDKEIVYEY